MTTPELPDTAVPAEEQVPPEVASTSLGGMARGGVVNVLGTSAGAAMTFAVTVVITRGLDREVAGVFFATTSAFIILVAVTQLGTNTGLVYFGSRARALRQVELIPVYLRTASWPVLGWSALVAGALALSAPLLGPRLVPDQPDLAVAAVRLLAPFLVVAAVENLVVSATRGLGTMRPTALLTMVLRPLAQLVLVAVAQALGGHSDVVLAWGGGYLASACVGVLWLRRLHRRAGLPLTAPGRRHREFWRFTAPRAFLTVAQIAMQRLDIILVGVLAGAVPAAVYTAATRFVVAGQMGTQAVSLAAQPHFAHHLAIDDEAGVRRLYSVSNAWLVLLTWPLYVLIAVFAGTIMTVFGDGYQEGARVVLVLSGALMLASLLGMVEVVLEMSGRTTWTLVNTVIALAVQVGLDVWLIPRFGVFGAALGWAGAIVVRKVLALVQVMGAAGLRPLSLPSVLAASLAVVGVGAPALVARAVRDDVVGLAVGGAVGAALFVGGAIALRRPLHLEDLVLALRSRRGRGAVSP